MRRRRGLGAVWGGGVASYGLCGLPLPAVSWPTASTTTKSLIVIIATLGTTITAYCSSSDTSTATSPYFTTNITVPTFLTPDTKYARLRSASIVAK